MLESELSRRSTIRVLFSGHCDAPSATGKTLAFMLPVVQQLLASPVSGKPVRALVLSPTRELASQIHGAAQQYGKLVAVPMCVTTPTRSYGMLPVVLASWP